MSKHWAEIRGGQERKGAKMTHTCSMIVAKGEKIMITKHGVPVATLQPANSAKRIPVRDKIKLECQRPASKNRWWQDFSRYNERNMSLLIQELAFI